MKWPYERRVDAAHAWGVVALGTAGLVAIPTVLATLHATDSHFRWWWPTNWMTVPSVIFLAGLALAVLPVMRSVEAPRSPEARLKAAPDREPVPMPGHAASGPPSPAPVFPGHAFISYVTDDASHVDKLQRELETAGVSVWRDTDSLWPGQDWRTEIRRAITDNSLVFIACFSERSTALVKSRQNEELALAIDELRMRRPDVPWLIPVRFDDCTVPDYSLGGGRTLASIQGADLFGDRWHTGVTGLLNTISRLVAGQGSSS